MGVCSDERTNRNKNGKIQINKKNNTPESSSINNIEPIENKVNCIKNNPKYVIDHGNLNNGGPVDFDKITESSKAGCRIFNKDTNEYATGFFMDIYSSFNCLLTNYIVISQNMVDSNSIIELSNDIGMKKELKLNKNERYIKCFEKYDITLIEIKKSDMIDKYYKPLKFDFNYKILPIKIISDIQNIYSLHYPKAEKIHASIGKMTTISRYEFTHTISTEHSSIGCPIILTNNNKVIGINKQGKNITENYGTFLGVIFEEIDKDIKQGLLNINININLAENNPSQNQSNELNIITAEIYIDKENVNKDVLIINSYEEFTRRIGKNKFYKELKNEEEIKKCEISINGNEIKDFSYTYQFKNDGKYKITYKFENNLKNLCSLFNGCSLLTSIDLSEFNAEEVIYMRSMFYECSSLTNINFSNFNTENVIDMSFMFSFCSSLYTLNLSDFNTENVIDMSFMFGFCSSLRDLDISNFNTENVTQMIGMFSECNLLKELNLSNFNTVNVENMEMMFAKCENLKKLNLTSFDTKNVTSMKGMFLNCISLEELDLSNFNTKNVTDMSEMFFLCSSLSNLDLTNFEIQNVKNIEKIFYGCISLKKDKLNKLKNYLFVFSGDSNNHRNNNQNSLNINENINVQRNELENNSKVEIFDSNLRNSFPDLMISNEKQLFLDILVKQLMNTEHEQRHQIEFFFIPNIIADLYAKRVINDDIMMNPTLWKNYEQSPIIIDSRFLEKISIQKINLKSGDTKFILTFPQPKYGNECFFAILYFDKNKRSYYFTLEMEFGNDLGCPEGSGLVCGQQGFKHLNFYTICKANLEDFQNVVSRLYKSN